MLKKIKYSLVASYEMLNGFLFRLPQGAFFKFFKIMFLKVQGAKVGKNILFGNGVWINPAKNISIGNNVQLHQNVLITTKGGIVIGEGSILRERVQIFSANHVIPPDRGRIFASGHTAAPVVIGKNVIIETDCIVLPGVKIGDNAHIYAQSVVTKEVLSGKKVQGNPAKEVE